MSILAVGLRLACAFVLLLLVLATALAVSARVAPGGGERLLCNCTSFVDGYAARVVYVQDSLLPVGDVDVFVIIEREGGGGEVERVKVTTVDGVSLARHYFERCQLLDREVRIEPSPWRECVIRWQ